MAGLRFPRVVCVGANLESEIILSGLIAIQANVVGLITVPRDKSSAISDYVDLHEVCRAAGIVAIDTDDINAPATLNQIRRLQPDFLLTLGWTQLFKEELLSLPAQYVIGCHPSPLPEGRGRAPIPWTILQGHARSAVTLFRVEIGVDSGPILHQRWFDVPARCHAMDLYRLAAEHSRDGFVELYRALEVGTAKEKPQDSSHASYRGKRTPADGHVNFGEPAEKIDALIRAVSHPYPGAYAYFGDWKVHIWRSSLESIPPYSGTIGQILAKRDGQLLIQAGDQPLWISDLTIEGHAADLREFSLGSKFGHNVEDEIHRLVLELRRLKGNQEDDRKERARSSSASG
jgi:methionyl-tRNA formyltransferase